MSEKITILIPCYNRAKYIKECITSILEQTYKRIKIICYDDGSTDNTVKIIKKIKDPRIILSTSNKNMGVSFARNQLMSLCKNDEIVCFQDSDDLSNIHRLELEYKEYKKGNNICVGGLGMRFNNSMHPNYKEIPRNKKPVKYPLPSMMFNRQINNYILNEEITLGAEDGIFRRLLFKNNKFVPINKIIYYIRSHSDRISVWKKKRKQRKSYENSIISKELKKLNIKKL